VAADTLAGVGEHFEFDDTTGTHDVIFADVGSGRGDYVLDGLSVKGIPVYRFVGEAKGRYRRKAGLRFHANRTARLDSDQVISTSMSVQRRTRRQHALEHRR
jgi:hypothetical protein